MINVWGSWCGPCGAKAADLAAASRRTARIAAFVGLNIRDPQPAAPRAFVRSYDIPYPHIFDPTGTQLVRFAGTLPPNVWTGRRLGVPVAELTVEVRNDSPHTFEAWLAGDLRYGAQRRAAIRYLTPPGPDDLGSVQPATFVGSL